ncbi:MAG: HAD domain-containing protein [bacterium]|nr:HAD domain-containing protein [bacterium]
MKVIFLDIDGVLNRIGVAGRTDQRYRGRIGIDPELAEKFNALVKRTGASVVLSSTFRLEVGWYFILKDSGIDTKPFIGATPRLPGCPRGEEVEKWLEDHDDVERYAIIDDESDMLAHQKLFKTQYGTGLTDEICDAVAAYLGAGKS